MTASRRLFATLAAVAMAITVPHAAGQQPPPTHDELTTSPYLLDMGTLDMPQRFDRYEYLAGLAEADGDIPRAARHLALACLSKTGLVNARTLSAPSCVRARQLAQAHHLVDVDVSLLVTEATVRAWALDVPAAIAGVQNALALGASLDPDRPDAAPILNAHYLLGAITLEVGKFDVALHELTFTRDHCAVAGNFVCVAYNEMWLCRLHTELGELTTAGTACEAARAASTRVADVLIPMNLGWIRGDLEEALNRHEASLASLLTSWRAAQIHGGEALRPTLMQSIADRLVTLGRLDEAEVWQGQLEHGIAAGVFAASYAPQTSYRRGQIARARGNADEAVKAFGVAARSAQPGVALAADYELSKLSRERADLDGARTALEHAIAKIEAARTNMTGAALRASFLATHAKAYGDLIGVEWDARGVAAAPAAIEIAESGRARALLDALGSAQVVGASAPTLTAAAVQATLGAGSVLVEYVSTDDRLFALTVTRDRVGLTSLPGAGTAAELSRRVDFFSALVQESDESALGPAARRLYADVLAPALAGAPPTAHTLIIAPDGPLQRLPFDALGDPRVIDRWDVVTVPSASSLAKSVRRATPTMAALVVTAPENAAELGALPAAPEEAAAIRRRIGGDVTELSGAGATREALERLNPGRFAVLHFASHALVDEARPLRSALVLTPGGADKAGRWSADEIYRANLGADLVVLSACATAAGAPSPGEGVMSLARAFLYAGAGATIATLWDVPDAPGPIFADVLYRELAAGRPLGSATADARRELRRRGAPPRVWAAYVLTGNPDARVGITGRIDSAEVSTRVTGSLAALLLFAAAVLRMWQGRTRIAWRAPALSGAALLVLAVMLRQSPERFPMDTGSRASRGAASVPLEVTLTDKSASWPLVAGVDQQIVELYDGAGLPVGSPVAATSPFALPSEARWIRVDARRVGQSLARSSLVALPHSAP